MSNAFTDAVDARLAEADAAIRERDAAKPQRQRRPSIADAVALACNAQADLQGRPLTDVEHGCVRAGFHACLLYHLEREYPWDEAADMRLLRALYKETRPVPGVYTPEQGKRL